MYLAILLVVASLIHLDHASILGSSDRISVLKSDAAPTPVNITSVIHVIPYEPGYVRTPKNKRLEFDEQADSRTEEASDFKSTQTNGSKLLILKQIR